MVPHVFTFLSRTTTQRRAQPGGTAPCLGASLQRCVPGMQHPWSSPSTQAGSEQGLGFSHFPVAQSRVGLGRVSCQAPCCLHQEERPWSGVSSRPGEGLLGGCLGGGLCLGTGGCVWGFVLFCIHNCGLVSDPYSWNATGM